MAHRQPRSNRVLGRAGRESRRITLDILEWLSLIVHFFSSHHIIATNLTIYPLYEIHGLLVYFVYFSVSFSVSQLILHYSNSSGIDALLFLFFFLLMGALLLFLVSFFFISYSKEGIEDKKTKNSCPFSRFGRRPGERGRGGGLFPFSLYLICPFFSWTFFTLHFFLLFFGKRGVLFHSALIFLLLFLFFLFLVYFFLLFECVLDRAGFGYWVKFILDERAVQSLRNGYWLCLL